MTGVFWKVSRNNWPSLFMKVGNPDPFHGVMKW